jgi:hypothetical protein
MIINLSKHEDTHAWGRNGRFVPAKLYVSGYKAGMFDQPVVAIEVESSKIGNNSPLKLRITVADAKKLQKAIAAAIKEAK